ncbi:saccharopine dehydrogenase, partial [Streptomyces sp. NPDC049577]
RGVNFTDPAGQAHLTAVGALLALRRALGADGAPPPRGVSFPEQTPLPRELPRLLEAHGVALRACDRTGDSHDDTGSRAA